MTEDRRASALGTIVGLLVIATAVAMAGLWLREYTHDRREVWLVNPGGRTAVVYFDDVRHTLVGGEVLAAKAPAGPSFVMRVRDGEVETTRTVTRTPGQQEVLLLDVRPAAAYVVVDLTPRFSGRVDGDAPRAAISGRRFRPKIVGKVAPQTKGPALYRVRGGDAATIGPLEGLPGAVWLARKYGRSVHKILRVAPDADLTALTGRLEQALADEAPLVPLELGIGAAVTSTSPPARR